MARRSGQELVRARLRWSAIGVALALASSACGASGETTQSLEPTPILTIDPAPETAVVDDELDERLDDIDRPWELDVAFACEEHLETVSLDQLLEPSSVAPPVPTGVNVDMTSLGSFSRVGDLTVADRPLEDTIPLNVVVDPEYGPFACVFARLGAHLASPWELVELDGTSATVAAIDCESLRAEVLDIGGHLALTLWVEDGEPSDVLGAPSCQLEIELPRASDDLRSGLTWPLVEPSEMHFLMATGRAPEAQVTDESLVDATCAIDPGSQLITVSWQNMPHGVDLDIVRNGVLEYTYPASSPLDSIWEQNLIALDRMLYPQFAADEAAVATDGSSGAFSSFPPGSADSVHRYEIRVVLSSGGQDNVPCGESSLATELPGGTCSIEFVGGAPLVVVVEEGVSGVPSGFSVLRDGEPIANEQPWRLMPDTTAKPGAVHAYSVRRSDPFGALPGDILECGTVEIPTFDDEPLSRLDRAEALYAVSVVGPVASIRVWPIEGDVEADVVSAWLVYENHPDLWLVFDQARPGLITPFEVYDVLRAAIAEGREVEFEAEPDTGVIVRFTIDGSGQRIECLSFDLMLAQGAPSCPDDSEWDLVRP